MDTSNRKEKCVLARSITRHSNQVTVSTQNFAAQQVLIKKEHKGDVHINQKHVCIPILVYDINPDRLN